MLREQMVYVCTCAKCSHKWITKTKEIPARCSKCNRVTWNDDYDFKLQQEPAQIVQRVEATTERKTVAELRELIAPIETGEQIAPVDVADQWQGWTEERQALDEIAGETVTYRQHIKTGKRKEIRRESAW